MSTPIFTPKRSVGRNRRPHSPESGITRCAKGLFIGLICLPYLALSGCSDPATTSSQRTGLHVQDAYIKRAVPGRKMTAAYATLINYTPDNLCFVDFEADFATRIELHVTQPVGGPNSQRVSMRRIHEHCIAPGERVTLEPGGKHLMVMGFDEHAMDQGPDIIPDLHPTSNTGKPAHANAPQLHANSTSGNPTATLRLGTRAGRLFAAEFAVVPFNYSPQNL